MGGRAGTTMLVVLSPFSILLLPLALLSAPEPPEAPEIPEGVVAAVDPAVAASGEVAIPSTEFITLGEDVDDGSVIDPFTGQPRTPAFRGVDGQRITPDRVRTFLDRYGSPMAPTARAIVVAGIRHGVDPRLTVAIAGTESSFGKHHRGYNAWGWDAPNGLTRWSSWQESIPEWTRLFAAAYRSGDPDVIGPRYCPDCERWPYTTRLFFSQI
jgi:hypothetical protein